MVLFSLLALYFLPFFVTAQKLTQLLGLVAMEVSGDGKLEGTAGHRYQWSLWAPEDFSLWKFVFAQ